MVDRKRVNCVVSGSGISKREDWSSRIEKSEDQVAYSTASRGLLLAKRVLQSVVRSCRAGCFRAIDALVP